MTSRSTSALFLCATLACAGAAEAASASAFLTGVVSRDGKPLPGVSITAAGNNVILHATTDAKGRYMFPALLLGSYTVTAALGGAQGEIRVDLGSGGASAPIALSLQKIGSVAVVRSTATRGSGSDVALDNETLTRSPYNDNFPEALIQLPGAVRGADGVVHLNGDHGVIDYLVDGVPLPQALNREVGSEIDPNDVSFLDVVEGAYPAEYGLRFGSVLNITTRSGTGPAGIDGDAHVGSYSDLDQTIGYHAPLAGGGGYSLAFRDEQSTRDSIRRISARRTIGPAIRISSRASRSRAARTTSPTSRSSTAIARIRFQTTSRTASPRRPTITRSKRTRSSTSTSDTRSA